MTNSQKNSGTITTNAKSNHFYNFLHLHIAFSFLESNGTKWVSRKSNKPSKGFS